MLQEAKLPVDVDEMHAAHRIIMRVEAAAYHDKMFLENQDAYASRNPEKHLHGLYDAGCSLRERPALSRPLHSADGAIFSRNFDLVVLPSQVERPPIAEESTGNALFNEPFTQIGFPAITLPVGRGEHNLPIGIQLGGRRFGEAALLSAARWCEAELGWVSEIPDIG